MSEGIKLGQLVTDDAGRDAVHIAIIPMTAMREMRPGERLKNGIVDPFLTANVRPGERFFLLLFPNTVTSLRHVWTHPAFADEAEPQCEQREQTVKRRSEADVWAERWNGAAEANQKKPLCRSFDAIPVPREDAV